MAISAEDKNFLVSLYVGYFNRAPDPAGLQFWIDQVEAGRDTNTIAADFAASPEAKSLYPFLTTPDVSSPTSFITAVYANLFNRAPDAAGQAFWEQQLSSGAVSPADAIDAIIKGATTAPDSTILANKNTVGLDFATDAGNTPGFTFDLNGASGSAATSAISGVTEDASTVIAAQAATDAYLNGVAGVGETLTLTTGLDDLTGTASDDTFKGSIDKTTVANSTLSPLDEIDGGAGTDTLEVAVLGALATADIPTALTNVENITARATTTVTVDSSAIAGVTSLASTQSTASTLTGAATTDVSVSGATGAIIVEGGKDVTVTDAAAGNNITIGDTTVNNGTVTVTDTDQGTGAIAIDGGTDVTVTASEATTGTITIGDKTGATAADQPSGAVVVNSTGAAYDPAGAAAQTGTIDVAGGSSVTVNQTAYSSTDDAATDTTGVTVRTQADVNVTASDDTTSVTLSQEDQIAAVDAVDAVDAVAGTKTVTFTAMADGDTTTVDGLAFTASKALTAEEVAQAFANLAASDTQAAGGTVENGFYTVNSAANYTTGAANGAIVTYTETTPGTPNAFTAVNGGANANPTITAGTTGVAAVTGVTGVAGIAAGDVVINDNGTKSVTTVTVDGAAAVTLGGNAVGTSLDALTTLSLANVTGATNLNSTATSLDLTVNDVDGAVDLGVTADTVETLNLTSTGVASVFAADIAAATALNITANADLNLTGSTVTALETVDITGAGDVTLGDVSPAATDITASTATGDISATVDNSTNVATGAGADTITIEATATNDIDGTVNLGAGNDTLVLDGDDNTVPTGTVDGGADNDTVSMTSANAQAYDNNTNFATAISGFERLTISDRIDVTGGVTIDLEALGFTNYVTLSGTTDGTDDTGATADGDNLTLSGLASGATLVLTDTQTANVGDALDIPTTIASVTDAATGTSDVLNVVTQVVQGDIDAGTLVAADVETINITADDTDADHDSDGNLFEAGERQTSTLDLNAVNATSVVIDGDANLTLDMTGNTAVTSIDASGMTGALTATAFGTATLTGGSGADALTADGSGDTLIGGAGDDTLTGANLTSMTGGAGADTFVMNTSANVNSYSTIEDLATGDIIDVSNVTSTGQSFVSSAVTLANTAVFQDFANAAVNQLATDNDDFAWFQFGGDTYIVGNDNQGDGANDDFENGVDSIIKIVGTVDLSTASYNQTDGTLEIA